MVTQKKATKQKVMNKALKKSIEHWEHLLEVAQKNLGKPMHRTGFVYDTKSWRFGRSNFKIGADECALCKEYVDCCGCPIAVDEDNRGCQNTPYIDILFELSCRAIFERPVVDKRICALVKEEMKFLKSLVTKP